MFVVIDLDNKPLGRYETHTKALVAAIHYAAETGKDLYVVYDSPGKGARYYIERVYADGRVETIPGDHRKAVQDGVEMKWDLVPSMMGAVMAEGDKTVYHRIARKVADLVAEKQQAYGDSFGQAHRVVEALYLHKLNPDKGVFEFTPLELRQMLAIVRIVDKLFRIANNPRGDRMGEKPTRDIIGYCLLLEAAMGWADDDDNDE